MQEIRTHLLEEWNNWEYSPFQHGIIDQERLNEVPGWALHRITGAANVWVIGAVMYQLLTLEESSDVDEMVEYLTEDMFKAQRGRIARSAATQMYPDYSEKLSELVLDCLNMIPEARPSPSHALETIDGWLKAQHENAMSDGPMPDGERVFYKANEINDMDIGEYNFYLSTSWWEEVFNPQEVWLDERWDKLRPLGRPDYVDPWRASSFYATNKRARDKEMLVPNSAAQRKSDRAKRRRIGTETDVVSNSTISEPMVPDSTADGQETLIGPKPTISNGDQMFTFPNGFQMPPAVANPQRGDVSNWGYLRRDPVTQVRLDAPFATPLDNPFATPVNNPFAARLPAEFSGPPQRGPNERFREVLTPTREVAGPYQSSIQAQRPQGHGQPGPYRSPAQVREQRRQQQQQR